MGVRQQPLRWRCLLARAVVLKRIQVLASVQEAAFNQLPSVGEVDRLHTQRAGRRQHYEVGSVAKELHLHMQSLLNQDRLGVK